MTRIALDRRPVCGRVWGSGRCGYGAHVCTRDPNHRGRCRCDCDARALPPPAKR